MAKAENLTRTFIKNHPVEAAGVLTHIAPEHCAALLNGLSERLAIPIFRNMLPAHAARCLEHLKPRLATTLIRALTPQNGAAVLRHCIPATRVRLLESLPAGSAIGLRLLLGYPGDVVGAWVDSRVPTLPPHTPIKDALAHVRRMSDEACEYLYIVDNNQRLQGVARLADAVRTVARASLSNIMIHPVPTLPAGAVLGNVREHTAWKEFHSLPVTDHQDRFLGVLHYRTVIEVGAPHASTSVSGTVTDALIGLTEIYWIVASGLIKSALPLAAELGRRRTPRVTR